MIITEWRHRYKISAKLNILFGAKGYLSSFFFYSYEKIAYAGEG